MSWFKTTYQKQSARITTLIVVILVLLMFVAGLSYLDPPPEYGVAVNFGTSNVGSGNRQPTKSVTSKNVNTNETPKENATQEQADEAKEQNETVENTNKANEVTEDLNTQDVEEALAIKRQKEAQAKAEAERKKAAAEEEAKAKAEAERIAKEKAEQEAKKKEFDNLLGNINNGDGTESGSEGNDTEKGDKGQPDGNPYAPSYFGDPGSGSGGVGYGLNGRGKGIFKPIKQNCNEFGLVVVKIVVDRNGKVISATPGVKGTKNTHPCLLEPAKKIALSGKWKPDAKAPSRQIGFVSINFKQGK